MVPWLFLQLSDSGFPTGGFAHSFGLEAAVQGGEVANLEELHVFLRGLLWQVGQGSLPFVTEAHGAPSRVRELDARLDVFLTNPVANRASRAQGRAFLSTMAKVFDGPSLGVWEGEVRRREMFAHSAPLFGAALREVGLGLGEVQALFLSLALRGALSAAVRLGVLGPLEAQRVQWDYRNHLDEVLAACGTMESGEATQPSPLLDLVGAHHDRLYSRLFQS